MAANNALKKIQAEVRRLRKEHPKMKYVDAQKKAGKMYRAGALGAVRTKKKVAAVKVSSTKSVGKTSIKKVGSVTPASIKSNMEKRISGLEMERKAAKTMTEKNRIQRKINGCHDVIDGLKKI